MNRHIRRSLTIGIAFAMAVSLGGWTQAPFLQLGPPAISLDGRFVLCNADGSRLAVVLRNEIQILDGTSLLSELVLSLPSPWMEFGLPSFSPDGQYLAAPASGALVMVWNLSTGAEAFSFEVSGLPYRRVFYAPSGDYLVNLAGNTIELRGASDGQLVRVFEGHSNFVITVAFSPDGTIMASAGGDGVIWFWDVVTGDVITQLVGHESDVSTLAFDSSGERLVSSSGDGIVRIWDVASAQALHEIAAHADRVTWFAINADSRILATASADATIRLWDMSTGLGIATLDLWAELGTLDGPGAIGIDPRSAAQVMSIDFVMGDQNLAFAYVYGFKSIVALWNLEDVL